MDSNESGLNTSDSLVTMELRNLDELLQPKLKPGFKIKEFRTQTLTALGDNYGSTMFALTVDLANGVTMEEETIELVAKLLPTHPEFRDMFQVDQTFPKESSMYTLVFPAMIAFQREKNIPEDQVLDLFAECYGARKSLCPYKTSVDNDAVLILENLKKKGFSIGNRAIGFDLEHSEFALRNLARFHAVLIAFRKDRPNEFERDILPWLNKLNVDYGMRPKSHQDMMDAMKAELLSVPEIVPLMKRIWKQVDNCKERAANLKLHRETPFNSFCHFDFWMNNMMIGYDGEDPRPKRMKIVDFQYIKYSSVAEDILFFIFTTTNDEVFQEKFDHLLDVYYEAFIEALKLNGCPLDGYSKANYLEEINYIAKDVILYQVLIMLKVMKMDKEKMSQMDALSEDVITAAHLLGPDYFHRLKLAVVEFEKRGWLVELEG